ncbi:MAG TPA: DUF1003 domain-containing protein [Gammaproteobacteria bacterium]|nr:DUF1003 domain-containing protein [Gammaproteobacteria bacterium]
MSRRTRSQGTCQVCHQTKPRRALLPAGLVRDDLLPMIREQVPDWSEDGFICFPCLNRFRTRYIRQLMEKDLGELDELEQEVVQSLQNEELLSENINEQYEQSLGLGDRIADKVAEFGGSWRFIISFSVFLAAWIILNSFLILKAPFDPYPYILLNLVLSLLAAMQAPVIMMSQNRQEERDRLRAENDYQVNLKAELEIRVINEKLDQILHHELPRLLEIQTLQADMLSDLHKKTRR